jgi:hypothetical protein
MLIPEKVDEGMNEREEMVLVVKDSIPYCAQKGERVEPSKSVQLRDESWWVGIASVSFMHGRWCLSMAWFENGDEMSKSEWPVLGGHSSSRG